MSTTHRLTLVALLGALTACEGEAGDAGPAGPQGEEGPQGALGPQGPQGEEGPPGQAGASMRWRGQWTAGTSYAEGEVVFHPGLGSSLICAASPCEEEPRLDGGAWAPVALRGGDGEPGEPGAEGPEGPEGQACECPAPPEPRCPDDTFQLTAKTCIDLWPQRLERDAEPYSALGPCLAKGGRLCTLPEFFMVDHCTRSADPGSQGCYGGVQPPRLFGILCEAYFVPMVSGPDEEMARYYPGLKGIQGGDEAWLTESNDCRLAESYRCCYDL